MISREEAARIRYANNFFALIKNAGFGLAMTSFIDIGLLDNDDDALWFGGTSIFLTGMAVEYFFRKRATDSPEPGYLEVELDEAGEEATPAGPSFFAYFFNFKQALQLLFGYGTVSSMMHFIDGSYSPMTNTSHLVTGLLSLTALYELNTAKNSAPPPSPLPWEWSRFAIKFIADVNLTNTLYSFCCSEEDKLSTSDIILLSISLAGTALEYAYGKSVDFGINNASHLLRRLYNAMIAFSLMGILEESVFHANDNGTTAATWVDNTYKFLVAIFSYRVIHELRSIASHNPTVDEIQATYARLHADIDGEEEHAIYSSQLIPHAPLPRPREAANVITIYTNDKTPWMRPDIESGSDDEIKDENSNTTHGIAPQSITRADAISSAKSAFQAAQSNFNKENYEDTIHHCWESLTFYKLCKPATSTQNAAQKGKQTDYANYRKATANVHDLYGRALINYEENQQSQPNTTASATTATAESQDTNNSSYPHAKQQLEKARRYYLRYFGEHDSNTVRVQQALQSIPATTPRQT